MLAKVARGRNIDNDESHRDLLFRRCLMEYRYFGEANDMQCWYDVHPLIKAIPEYKSAVEQLQS